MARLPIPGSDDGDWGNILNGFLLVSLNSDGSLQSGALGGGGALLAANNLSDVQSQSVARTNLGLGSAATQNASAFDASGAAAAAQAASLPLTGGTMTGPVIAASQVVATSGTAVTLNGLDAEVTLSANCTFTFPSLPSSGHSQSFVLAINQPSSDSYTITLPNGTAYDDGSTPSAPTSGNTNEYVVYTRTGSKWHVKAIYLNQPA